MASARLEKLEAGQADMRTDQMNLIDLSTQRPPHPRAVAGWTFVPHSLPGNARPAARAGVLIEGLRFLRASAARQASALAVGLVLGQHGLDLQRSCYTRAQNGPLMEQGEVNWEMSAKCATNVTNEKCTA